TTLGWMMWNWLVTGLASGATVMLYDGSPLAGNGKLLFDYIEQEQITHFGVSAKFIDTLAKNGLPATYTHELDRKRTRLNSSHPEIYTLSYTTLFRSLFDYIEQEQITHFGVSAKFIDTLAKNGLPATYTHE